MAVKVYQFHHHHQDPDLQEQEQEACQSHQASHQDHLVHQDHFNAEMDVVLILAGQIIGSGMKEVVSSQ